MDLNNNNLILLGLIVALVLFVMNTETFKKVVYLKPCPKGHYRNSNGSCVKKQVQTTVKKR